MSLLPISTHGQGNIPKGYDALIRIVPPDTLKKVTDIYWPYANQKYLFVKYGYDWKRRERPDILVVDTDNWKNFTWYTTVDKYSKFYGVTDNFKTLVLERIKTFLFFTSIKYQLWDFTTGKSRFLDRKELLKYIEQNGKLDPGKSFHLSNTVLSSDRNYLIVKPEFLGNFDDLQQKTFELTVFKYHGD